MLMIAGGGTGVDEVLNGNQAAERGPGGASRHLDGCVGGYGAGDLRIQVRLTIIHVGARIGASAATTQSRMSGCDSARVLAEKSAAVAGYIVAVGIGVATYRSAFLGKYTGTVT